MGVVTAFRSSIYKLTYIASNAHLFINNDWIDTDQLRQFLLRADDPDPSSSPRDLPPTRVKLEEESSATRISTEEHPRASLDVSTGKTRTLKEGNREILEILSDSDTVSDSEDDVMTGTRESSPLPPSNIPSETSYAASDFNNNFSDEGSGIPYDLQKSDTQWLDPQISSQVRVGPFRVTKNITVNCVEYLTELPSIIPIPEVPTAFVIGLDHPKFAITNNKGKLHSVDALIKNKDNDSWTGNTGAGDSKVAVTFEPGQPSILCRRSRLACKGSYVCERVDPQLLKVSRRDLDPASRDAIFAAQRQMRREEGTMAERKAAEFAQVVRDQKCSAIDANGVKCKGMPFLESKNQASLLLRLEARLQDKAPHWTIPHDVDEVLFHKAFHSQPLATDSSKDTPLCSTIVHPHAGLKQHNCPYAHINLGKQVTSRIINRPCDAARTIYVPVDPSIRKALIIHNNNIAHNHPMPALTKVSYELKASHREGYDPDQHSIDHGTGHSAAVRVLFKDKMSHI
ncbi:hypothetical protein DFH09DRAFT_1444395 [Mycena vulgaris]|nr:hypothetical protein DFH09DRAFT_1444395 [Mycena vulgaris]